MANKVSIITPLYNKSDYITDTIQSALNQSMGDWEMFIVDNLSTDSGFEIAQECSDSRLQFLSNPVKGPGSTRNVGLDAATGEWILYLDADDLIKPDYLTKMLEAASATPEADVIATSWKEFRSDCESREMSTMQPADLVNKGANIEDSAIAYTCWAIHAAIVKRSWLGDLQWPVELDGFLAEDTAYWFRVVTGAKIAYAEFSGALYRTHTLDCRSDYSPEAWFKGNHQAMLSNLAFLEGQGRSPSVEQIESLIRAYSSLFTNARRAGHSETAERACCEATMWLAEFKKLGGDPSLSMKLRSILGVKAFEQLRQMMISI